ncbi:hypothetical protein ACIQ9E_26270 [Streptomyces sp. NPDC094448]|uniref:hypothetical protein n=1 Tax=Streptomyces sp. NPDC094448 TaxID=3366063 RepID=UPI0037F359CB
MEPRLLVARPPARARRLLIGVRLLIPGLLIPGLLIAGWPVPGLLMIRLLVSGLLIRVGSMRAGALRALLRRVPVAGLLLLSCWPHGE